MTPYSFSVRLTPTAQIFLLILLAVLLGGSFLYSLSAILIPFLLGFLGAYILKGLVNRLASWGVSRGFGSAFVLLGAIILLILLSVLIFPYLHHQLVMIARSIPKIAEKLFASFAPFLDKIANSGLGLEHADLRGQLTSRVGDILSWAVQFCLNILTSGWVLANLLYFVVLTPVILFYFLKDWPSLAQRAHLLLPARYAQSITEFVLDVHNVLSAYGRGQLKVSLILFFLYGGGLWLAGLEQGPLLGVIMAILAFIPYIGMIAGFGLTLATALANLPSWGGVGSVALCFLVIAGTDAYMITPRLIGTKVGLHPIWTIFALLAGGTWLGLLGILFALPAAAIVGVGIRWGVSAYFSSSFYKQPSCDSQLRDLPAKTP